MRRLFSLAAATLAASWASADTIYVGGTQPSAITAFSTNGTSATFAVDSVAGPGGMGIDAAGSLYVPNSGANAISKITSAGVTTLFALDPGDGSVLNNPQYVILDNVGNVYAGNVDSDTIEVFTPAGVPSVYAADPGDGSVLNGPAGMAFDSAGNLFVANNTSGGNDFIEVVHTNGTYTRFATDPGDGSVLNGPAGMAFDNAGNLYVANNGGTGTIEKFAPAATPTTFISSGLHFPCGMASDPAGNIYVVNQIVLYGSTVVKYQTNGSNSIVVNNLFSPFALTADKTGNLFIGDFNAIREQATNGTTSVHAYATLSGPEGLAADNAGNVYAASTLIATSVTRFASNGAGANFALAGSAPYGLSVDTRGNLFAALSYGNQIVEFAPNGSSSVFATDPGSGAVLNFPQGLVVDGAGNVYAQNYGTNTIEKFTSNGVPSVFASTGLNTPYGPGLAVDKAGNLYAEPPTSPATIAKFAPNGTQTTFVTDPGDGSLLSGPIGMAFDSAGNLYVVNGNSATIEMFTTNGVGTQFASTVGLGANFVAIARTIGALVAPPTLFITRLGAKVLLSWPVAAGNFYLQSSSNLKAGSWTTLSNLPPIVSTNYVQTNGIGAVPQYYRLISY